VPSLTLSSFTLAISALSAAPGGQLPFTDPATLPQDPGAYFVDVLYLDVPDEYATIQEAIDASSGVGNTVRIAAGYYLGNYTVDGKSLSIEAVGDVTLAPSVDAPTISILDTPEGGLVHLNGLRIETSNPRAMSLDLQDGHAVLASNARIQVTECEFQNCRVGMGRGQNARNGAGIKAIVSDIWIDRTDFSSCEASGHGGAIYAYLSTIEMSESTVSYCEAGTSGGGVSVAVTDLTLSQCDFDGNTAGTDGGHVRFAGGDLVVTRCLFEDGLADDGGAMLLEEGQILWFGSTPPAVTLEQSRFAANYSSKPTTGADVIKQKAGMPVSTHDIWYCESDESNGVSIPFNGVKYADNCEECWADVNFDGITDVHDLVDVLMQWGTRDPFANTSAFLGGPEVDSYDLIDVLNAFGTCGSTNWVIQ